MVTTNHLGEEKPNKNGTLMKIVEYTNTENIIVEFQDEHKFRKRSTYSNFKNGGIKNPYDKTIFGIACLGDGKYGSWKNSRGSRDTYLNWVAMLQRCYVDMNGKYPTYYNIATVCDEWFNFQNFAEWYESHYYYIPNERLHIDKDIKIKGNMMYGEDTCILVPQRVNEIFHKNGKKIVDTDLPETIRRRGDKFYVEFRSKGIGTYDTVEECLEKYNIKKLEYLRNLVDEYGTLLPNDVREVLLAWTPDKLITAT